MLLQSKLERAIKFQKEKKEEYQENQRNDNLTLEKNDGLSMAIAAALTFLPIFAVLFILAILCL